MPVFYSINMLSVQHVAAHTAHTRRLIHPGPRCAYQRIVGLLECEQRQC